MTKLKPCPFCGGEAETYSSCGMAIVECKRCRVSSKGYTSEDAAAEAWNARADAYTREDVEGAFVSGYSLGSLPVGSDPRWDENEQTVDEHMAELGWVRERTCQMETAEGCQNWMSCSECDADYYNDQPINYCPNCGAKVVDE